MEKLMKKYGGLVLFYVFIVLCVVVVNARFDHLNTELEKEVIALND